MRHAFRYLTIAAFVGSFVGCSSVPPASVPPATAAVVQAPPTLPPLQAAEPTAAAVQPIAPAPDSREARMADALKDYQGAKSTPQAQQGEAAPASKKKKKQIKARPAKTAPN